MSRRPKLTKKERILAAIAYLKSNETNFLELAALYNISSAFSEFKNGDNNSNDAELQTFLLKIQNIEIDEKQQASGQTKEDASIMANSIVEIFRGMDSLSDTQKPLSELIMNNFAERKLGLTIDLATNHGRIAPQLKKHGVDVDVKPELNQDDIEKIKAYFQTNGKEILELFAKAKITPEALHEHIAKHLRNAFDAFQKIKGSSVASEDVKKLMKTLENVGEATKAAAGLGNDFSSKKSKENLLKTIKEKLPDTSDDLLVEAAAAAFGTTEQVVRFEQAQKAEVEKMIATAKARRSAGYQAVLDRSITEAVEEFVKKPEGFRKEERQSEKVKALPPQARTALKRGSASITRGEVDAGLIDDAKKQFEIDKSEREAAESRKLKAISLHVSRNRAKAMDFVGEGNLGEAIKSLEKAKDARVGVLSQEIESKDKIKIHVKGVKLEVTDSKTGTEDFEKEYLSFVMAALDIAELEGKTKLKADLLERAPKFVEEFLEQAKKKGAINEDGTLPRDPSTTRTKAEKILNKLLDAEIKNHLVKSLEKAGISNASDKLIVAQTFQGLALHHPSTVTIKAVEIDVSTATPLQKAKAEALGKIFEKSKPDEFAALPWWHQDLMQKYAPAILAGQSPLPPSVSSVLGTENYTYAKQTQRLQMTEPPHPFVKKIASLPFVQKFFSGLAIIKRCNTEPAPSNSEREERNDDFKTSYTADAKEITIEIKRGTEPQQTTPPAIAATTLVENVETERTTAATDYGDGKEFLMRSTMLEKTRRIERAERRAKVAEAVEVRVRYNEMYEGGKITEEQKEVLELLLDKSPSIVANVLSAIEDGLYPTKSTAAQHGSTTTSAAVVSVLSEVGKDLTRTTDGLSATSNVLETARVAVSTRSQEPYSASVAAAQIAEPEPRARAPSVGSAGGGSVVSADMEAPAPTTTVRQQEAKKTVEMAQGEEEGFVTREGRRREKAAAASSDHSR